MKFSATVIATSLLALVAAAPASIKADGPDPKTVWVQGITTGGTGCPAGTVSQQISNDRSTFTLIFDQYVASIGPGVPVTENRKNCQLNVHLRYPGGWQYSIFSATYRGYAQLEGGQAGTQKSTYYFSGDSHQTSTQTDFRGPYNGDYKFTDNVDQTTNVWSPCGKEGMLNINSQVRLTGNNKVFGQLTTDSVDGKFTQILGLSWRRC
ncbi:hypothetical protein TWF102_004367 [Orbilia oligospora]|uniref:Secreted protein n=1 Tax=Orbilia oligospora TaxID=2813651 RepID=A0A7C8JHR2_ORBOL|nr:hypothetical protein TWF103_000858 [Orbilia oligospora]KAF3090961.1 hypothetical protein TWF706_009704 [Orbilia oligospora]KAF3102695.1 hypothetical protein TWF102_004367 [Orbilia oligospora]KAF3127989.1 hypothetical protein TWF594_011843 [Orbilia oligospora]KAF3130184.1 hypothetical protein TWF703_008351 [Orbilia oligospora]